MSSIQLARCISSNLFSHGSGGRTDQREEGSAMTAQVPIDLRGPAIPPLPAICSDGQQTRRDKLVACASALELLN